MQNDPRARAQVAMDALKRGDNLAARKILEQLVSTGNADASIYFALAIACQRLRDKECALTSISVALEREATNFQYLLLKADLLADTGQHRRAAAFYLSAVRVSAEMVNLPVALQPEMARAQKMCAHYAAELEELILSHLANLGSASGRGNLSTAPRVGEALEILFGRKQIFPQRPRYFNFPGLAPIQFFDPTQFNWIARLEAQTEQIRVELENLLTDHNAFRPYVESRDDRPGDGQDGMVNNPDWSAFYLWKNGQLVDQNAARCPFTTRAMADVPLTRIANRSPSVLFSLLRPGAHIPPHNGLINTRLIAHLPLIVPGKCRLRVGNDTREWQAGKVWVFDDTIEHEAWNDSDQTRVILLFEIDRPDVTADEQALVREIFDAIDRHSGQRPEWEI